MNVSIKEVSISLGCFNYWAQYCEDLITRQMISLVILFDHSLFMQSISGRTFKTIKQLICCENHSHLCHLDYFDFECFRVKVFYNIGCHGYQIIESFRLPFVFSRRAFATILNATTFILLLSKCQLPLSQSWWSAAEPLFCRILGRPEQHFFRPRPTGSRCNTIVHCKHGINFGKISTSTI